MSIKSAKQSQRHNQLEEIILESHKSYNKKSNLTQILNKPSDYFKDCQIKKQCLVILNNLYTEPNVTCNNTTNLYLKGLVYDIIKTHNLIDLVKLNQNIIINTINIIFSISESLNGCVLASKLAAYAKILLKQLLNRNDIIEEDKNSIKSLLQTELSKEYLIHNQFEDFHLVKETQKLSKKSTNQKLEIIQKLSSLLSECQSLEEQLDICIQKIPPIIQNIQLNTNSENSEILIELTKFLKCILTECNYSVILSLEEQVSENILYSKCINLNNKNMIHFENQQYEIKDIQNLVIQYQLTQYLEKAKNYEGLFDFVYNILSNNLQYPSNNELQFETFVILKRLYYLLPQYKQKIVENILVTLSFIDQYGSQFHVDQVTPFYQYLIKNKNNIFIGNFNYQRIKQQELQYNTNQVKDNVLSIDQIDIDGALYYQQILPGQTYSIFVEVIYEWSILCWTIQVEKYDIGFKLQRVCSFQQLQEENQQYDQLQIIYIQEKISTNNTLFIGQYLVKEPGLYQVILENNFSWFKSKNVKYKINLLTPQNQQEDTQLNNNYNSDYKQQQGQQYTQEIISNEISNFTNALLKMDEENSYFIAQKGEKIIEIELNFTDNEIIDWNKINQKVHDTYYKILSINDCSTTLIITYERDWLREVLLNQNNQEKCLNAEEFITKKMSFLSEINENQQNNTVIFCQSTEIIESLAQKKYSLREILLVNVNFNKNRISCSKSQFNKKFEDFDLSYQIGFSQNSQNQSEHKMKTFQQIFKNESDLTKKFELMCCLVVNCLIQNDYNRKCVVVVNENEIGQTFQNEENKILFLNIYDLVWSDIIQDSLSYKELSEYISSEVKIVFEKFQMSEFFN